MTTEPTLAATPTGEPEPTATPIPPTPVPTPSPTPTLEVIHNVPYVPDGDRLQCLDIYLPAGDGPFPTILGIHGGGGDKAELTALARYLAARGYAVLSINHRQYPDVTYPIPAQDAFCALAWTVANAETYGFDLQRIVILGHSAGGTLAALLGVVDDPAPYLAGCPHPWPEGAVPWAVVTFTGIFDYTDTQIPGPSLQSYFALYLGGALAEIPDVWDAASPSTWVDGSEPPFLLIHGADDRSVPPAYSEAFAATLAAAGVPAQLVIVPNADHDGITASEDSFEAVVTFLTGR
ncbi:MAG: alpha/beta hydrolase [Anaerolineae bacterium]|nr:alpha/beta hydrolase [Anaerolineae bacterium]